MPKERHYEMLLEYTCTSGISSRPFLLCKEEHCVKQGKQKVGGDACLKSPHQLPVTS